MTIYLGADHGGFALKEKLIADLKGKGHEVVDVGNREYDKGDDFPDFAQAVAKGMSGSSADSRGILLCRSGVGMDIVANRYKGIRSVLGISPEHVARSRHDEDTNVLCIAGDFTAEDDIPKMVDAFLSTPFAPEERYLRRLKKIDDIN